MKFKHILILLLVAFVGGVAITGFIARHYGWLELPSDAKPVTSASKTAAVAATSPVIPVATPSVETVSDIENRLSRINSDAAVASANAGRAESLLIAFAARRAIDSGAPLGYLSDQLRLRFGASQPQAVVTILDTAQRPVTLEALQSELKSLEQPLLTGDKSAGIWARVQHEFSELFVLRLNGAPSPAPSQRLLRVQALVESGNISEAISEVSAMPGAVAAAGWLDKARRYNQVRKALDTLERNAIVAPPVPVILPAPAVTPDAAASDKTTDTFDQ
jgi:hypothetical protein